MHCIRRVTESLVWVGGSDRRLARFENAFPVPRGMAYNAYVLLDEKTALMDTVDWAVSGLFFENLEAALEGRELCYVVVSHMEPDHCATLAELCRRYPGVQIVCSAKAAKMVSQFFGQDLLGRIQQVAEGDQLSLGSHCLRFFMAPMVHWPEVMVSYEEQESILFSADAFGSFGALNGSLFADEMDFERDWLPEARRYYANIVGKYGAQVQALLAKISGLCVSLLCPLHGPVWRKNIPWYVNKYRQWSAYEPEDNAVLILYGSIYGHTENAAEILAAKLAEGGAGSIAMYDVSSAEPSLLVAEAFRCSHIVLCSVTHNNGIFHTMDHLLAEFKDHNLQNRTVALLQNGSWAPNAENLLRKRLEEMKGMRVLGQTVTLLSTLAPGQDQELTLMAGEIIASLDGGANVASSAVSNETSALPIDPKAFFAIGYGLYVLTARDGDRDNGCIINTVIQVTSQPARIAMAVNKLNLTHDLIQKTGLFNVSVLTEDTPFSLFQRFGFQSGRQANKFEGSNEPRSANGLRYLETTCNALLSGKVLQSVDCGSHTLFIADVTQAEVLPGAPTATYAYYFAHIKPKAPGQAPAGAAVGAASKAADTASGAVKENTEEPSEKPRRGFVCKICGYFHEAETLPPDFICPICKHGAQDFEPVGFE